MIAVVSSAEKREFLLGLGADRVITYEDLRLIAERPVDVVLDGVGGEAQQLCLDVLAPFGRLVSYNGDGAIANVNELRMYAQTVIGFSMAPYFQQRRQEYDENLRNLWSLRASGALRPVISTRLPLERAADAHRMVENRQNLGKIVLRPDLPAS